MDVVKLVEDGTYKKEDLGEQNRAFVNGMEFVRTQLLENMYEEADFDSFSPTLSKVIKEVADEVIRMAKEWFYVNECEMIVALSDMEATERENKTERSV